MKSWRTESETEPAGPFPGAEGVLAITSQKINAENAEAQRAAEEIRKGNLKSFLLCGPLRLCGLCV